MQVHDTISFQFVAVGSKIKQLMLRNCQHKRGRNYSAIQVSWNVNKLDK